MGCLTDASVASPKWTHAVENEPTARGKNGRHIWFFAHREIFRKDKIVRMRRNRDKRRAETPVSGVSLQEVRKRIATGTLRAPCKDNIPTPFRDIVSVRGKRIEIKAYGVNKRIARQVKHIVRRARQSLEFFLKALHGIYRKTADGNSSTGQRQNERLQWHGVLSSAAA